MTKVFTLDGKLINVGEWDYQRYQHDFSENPWVGEGAPPEDWDFKYRSEEIVGNPLPVGAVEEDRNIVESAKGRLLFAEDWHGLREDAYPALKDQLDAFWKGGDAATEMAAMVQSIKDRYPKTEADQ